jgi:hypothetical protein
MTTMRAVLIRDEAGPVENLYIGETAKPIPAIGEVLVKVGNITFPPVNTETFVVLDKGLWFESNGYLSTGRKVPASRWLFHHPRGGILRTCRGSRSWRFGLETGRRSYRTYRRCN